MRKIYFIIAFLFAYSSSFSQSTRANAPVIYSPPFTLTLPIKLFEFTVMNRGGKTYFSWTAAEDGDGGSYSLETSEDKIKFTPVAIVPAGNINADQHYEKQAGIAIPGKHYYRLVVTDNSKQKNYSPVRVLNVSEVDLIEAQVFPNPAQADDVHVRLSNNGSNKQVNIFILDIQGRTVMNEYKTLYRNLDMTYKLKPGIYILKVVSVKDQSVITDRLIVQ